MSGARKFFGQLLLAALVVIGLVVLVGVVVLLSRYPARIAIISAIVVVACFVLGVVLRPFSSRVKPGTIIELDLDAAPSQLEGMLRSRMQAILGEMLAERRSIVRG